MFSRIRKRITFANVVMTLALVFAMTGGAYAAKHYLITSTKQISPKVLKALKGNAGPAGPMGPTGAKGDTGPAGKNGEPGKEGSKGGPGTNGKDGVSVASSTEPKGANCKEGGSKFVAANGTTYACNGKEGSPWTAGGTLPSEQTETGTWSFSEPETDGAKIYAAISFPIPLKQTSPPHERLLDAAHVFYVGAEELSHKTEPEAEHAACPSEAPANLSAGEPLVDPRAAPGNLCVYEVPRLVDLKGDLGPGVTGVQMTGTAGEPNPGEPKFDEKASAQINTPLGGFFGGSSGAGASGAEILLSEEGTGKHFGGGVWAVTAE